jgi:hypothetical protein
MYKIFCRNSWLLSGTCNRSSKTNSTISTSQSPTRLWGGLCLSGQPSCWEVYCLEHSHNPVVLTVTPVALSESWTGKHAPSEVFVDHRLALIDTCDCCTITMSLSRNWKEQCPGLQDLMIFPNSQYTSGLTLLLIKELSLTLAVSLTVPSWNWLSTQPLGRGSSDKALQLHPGVRQKR